MRAGLEPVLRVGGTSDIRRDAALGGVHVAGASTATAAHPRGIARAICGHALATARASGYKAMQVNCVVASNAPAIELWHRMGFATVGRLPGAIRHPALGCVDALAMLRGLEDIVTGEAS